MDFRTRRILFITPFYTIFEFFLLKYIFLLIGDVEDSYILIIAVILGLMHFIPMLAESKKSTLIGRVLSVIDGVWLWASLMFLIDLVFIYLVNMFFKLPYNINIVLLSIVPILEAYNYYKAHKLVVKEKTLIIDNLKENINIVHLSDIHFGSVRHRKIIQDVSDKLKELESTCDIVIISGDLADGSSVVLKDDFKALSEVNMPIVFTPGNHDFYPGIENVVEACKNAGIIVLDNESFQYKNLNIFGLTFSFSDREVFKVDESLIKKDALNILNYHVPYNFDEFSKIGFDIQLSGHTHGGQFYPMVWFSNSMFKYNKGLFKNFLGKYLHVTTGIGSMDTPMRWGTDSEIVILKLKSN